MTPTQRSLKLMRDGGYKCAVVERWNPHARIRQDLFGFADLLAYQPETGQLVFVQTTSGSGMSARVSKLRANETAMQMCRHYRVVVHGWAKRGPRGKRKTWGVRVEVIT